MSTYRLVTHEKKEKRIVWKLLSWITAYDGIKTKGCVIFWSFLSVLPPTYTLDNFSLQQRQHNQQSRLYALTKISSSDLCAVETRVENLYKSTAHTYVSRARRYLWNASNCNRNEKLFSGKKENLSLTCVPDASFASTPDLCCVKWCMFDVKFTNDSVRAFIYLVV